MLSNKISTYFIKHNHNIPLVPESCNAVEQGNVRLIGNTSMEGYVEVCNNGNWGTICYDNNWDTSEALVVCNQLLLSKFGK